jgi:hypothetical protein
MKRKLETVEAIADTGPFTQAQVRWWLFNRAINGMDDLQVVTKIGRRVYIDVDAFDRWIEAQNARAAA